MDLGSEPSTLELRSVEGTPDFPRPPGTYVASPGILKTCLQAKVDKSPP